MINNIDEPWDGHSYEVVESFIKDELKGKYTKTEDYSPGNLPVFGNDGEIVSSDISTESLISKNDGPVADWDEDNPYDTAYIKNKPVLSAVAKTGNYEDLSGKPSLSKVAHTGDYYDLSNKPSLARVATSGSYNDLTNKPETTQVNADWLSNNGPSAILNKPNLSDVATSGDYRDLTNKPEIPTDVSELTNDAGYITSEDIPPQMNADWNATGGPAEILNKPSDVGDFTNDVGYITNADIPTDVSAFVNDAGYLTSDALTPITEVIPSNASSTNKLADKNYVNTGLSSKASVDSVETSINSLETRIDLEKQNKLVDGVNIKTINGEPILGEGNIEIQRGANGVDAVNPFKGWFDNDGSLQTQYPTPSIGDYAYVKDTNSVHIWRCASAGTWADSLTEFNPSNNQSFRTGENLNEVGMSDNMKSASENDVAKASTVTELFSEIGDDTFVETKVNNGIVTENKYVYVINGSGSLVSTDSGESASSVEYEIPSGEKLRFLGFKINDIEVEIERRSGYAFGYYTEEDGETVWKTTESFIWDYDPYMESVIKREYILDIPEGSTHFRTTSKINTLDITSEIYCYVRSGKSVQDKIDEINGYVRVLDSVNAKYTNKILDGGWKNVKYGYSVRAYNYTYTESSTNIEKTVGSIGWRASTGATASTYNSKFINIEEYIKKGYNRIKIFSGNTLATGYTFTSTDLTTDTNNEAINAAVNNKQLQAILAQLSTVDIVSEIPAGEYKIIDIPENTDAKYLYFSKNKEYTYHGYYGSEDVIRTFNAHDFPICVLFQKIEKNPGTILKNSNRDVMTDISGKPIPPKLHNLKWNGSYMEDSETALTTAGIYGDFVFTVNKEYKINRVMYINQNGEIVNEYIVRESSPTGVIDGWGSAGRQTYGSCWRPLQCGVIIEITKMNSEEPISSKENVFKNFFWIDNNLMKSELLTSPHYNSETAVDDDTDKNPENMYYTKDSVRSALKRAKIPIMIAWRPLRYIMSTSEATRPFRGTPGVYELGIPYSRSNCKDTWFGFEISPYTYLSAISNPYSIMYTDKMGFQPGGNISVLDEDNYATTNRIKIRDDVYDERVISEYGITYGIYGSQHGIPLYGMVCSAYGSFVYGYLVTNDTSHFINDPRCYLLEEHGFRYSGSTKQWKLQYPVQAADIPPLTIITTPGHTYAVIDFYLDENGERIAAIVAESTHPYTRVGLYSMERFQARLNAEYDYFVTKESIKNDYMIEVNCIKPSVLDENKNINVWDVKDLYQIDSTPLLGNCETNHDFPKNIMFFMGDKAVIVRRNAKLYNAEQSISGTQNIVYNWVIIKPEGLYKHLVLERWSRGIDGVWETFTYNSGTSENPVYQETIFDIDQIKQPFVNQANQNNEYFKINLGGYIPYGPGKYRAYLTYEKPVVDNNGDPVIGENNEPETVTVKSVPTQWIVLAADIYKDGTKAIWVSESNNPDFLDESSPYYSPDEYAMPVFAARCGETGAGGAQDGNQLQVNAKQGWVTIGSFYAIKVGFACNWGVGTRRVRSSYLTNYVSSQDN